MTVRDALLWQIGEGPGTDGADLALLHAGLDGAAPYLPEMRAAVERAAIEPLFRGMAVASETEGGLSISRTAREMRARLLWLARRHGRTDILREIEGAATVSDISRKR